MDNELKEIIDDLARQNGITTVEKSFFDKLTWYTSKPSVKVRRPHDQAVIQAYLCSAAIRIAKEEAKATLDEGDLKAAIWYFHVPVDEVDPCPRAAEEIVEIETRRRVEIVPRRRQVGIATAARRKDYELERELRNWTNKKQLSGGNVGGGSSREAGR